MGLGLSALAVFGLLAWVATSGGGSPTSLDQTVAAWFHEHRVAGLTTWMLLATGLASTVWVSGLTLVIALGLVWHHAWHRLFTLGLIVPGGMAANYFLKLFFHRPRPMAEASLPMLAGYGFPSGHAMAATLLYGGLVCLAWSEIDAWCWRMGAALGAFVLVALVGLSRVQLGAHYLSDVLGAFAFGVAWLAFSLAAAGSWRQRIGQDR